MTKRIEGQGAMTSFLYPRNLRQGDPAHGKKAPNLSAHGVIVQSVDFI
jgi:hypothetical protein